MLALTNGKDIEAVLNALKPIIGHLILTKFSGQQDLPKKAIDPKIIAKVAEELNITSSEIIENPEQAFETLMWSENPYSLVTGSFFLLNHVRPKLKELGQLS
jgi:folylpolyglutamate synthase/dihydropteroate synthase